MGYGKALARSGPLLTAVPIFGIATGALFPIVALQLEALSSGPAFIGLTTAVYYSGSFLAAVTFGKILNRVSYRIGFLISALFAAMASFALTLTEDQLAWLVLRFIGGFSLGAYYVVVDGWFQALADRRTRGKLFATYETIRLAATAGGPVLLVVGSVTESLWIVSLVYLAAIIPALLTPEPGQAASGSFDSAGLVEVVRCFPASLLMVACGGMANASFYGLSAVYASGVGMTLEAISFFVAFVLIAPAVVEIPLGALADRFTRLRVAAICGAVALMASLLLAGKSEPSLWLACIGGAVVGGSMVPVYAFGLSRMIDASDEAAIVSTTSAGLIAYNAGAFAGPVLAGLAIGWFGPTGLYIFLSIIAATVTLSAVSDMKYSRCCPEYATG